MANWLKDNLSKIKNALFKTRSRGLPWQASTAIDLYIEINEDFYDDLSDKLIRADIGIDLSEKIISDFKEQIKEQKIKESDFKNKIKEAIKSQLSLDSPVIASTFAMTNTALNIVLIVGVNGSGKTTSIGKLAKYFKEEGFKVLIVAADTFRAAAGEQLNIWAQRAGIEIFSPPDIKKPDAVVFSAIEKAKKENYSLLLIDTAGRLHSQTNLMAELKKIDSVIEKQVKAIHELPQQIEKLIVLDATIGQNAITQAELFSKAIGLTGIILAKLDSSSKGGVVLNIMNKLSLPVKLIGTGEKIDDLAEFNLDEYLDALIA
ncbi:MAG: signal recognition particle-docking protein FtsY [Candidatus Melainabacteria bacterium RIFCSPLOWO2_12_FULL_35_11]|nr:MAG: signal recognition particle-docking protein FtsY [Candidatus Melainabacteria bacterium RIFCSPLOWO2_12_FULL_35_11]